MRCSLATMSPFAVKIRRLPRFPSCKRSITSCRTPVPVAPVSSKPVTSAHPLALSAVADGNTETGRIIRWLSWSHLMAGIGGQAEIHWLVGDFLNRVKAVRKFGMSYLVCGARVRIEADHGAVTEQCEFASFAFQELTEAPLKEIEIGVHLLGQDLCIHRRPFPFVG